MSTGILMEYLNPFKTSPKINQKVDLEEWKTIEDFPEFEVSSLGNVRRKDDLKKVSQVLAGEPQYFYVNLKNKEGRKLVRVHRLVAQAFLVNPYHYPIVDHIDRDKFNNHVSNLRWTSKSGNQRNMDNNVKLPCGKLLIEQVQEEYPYDTRNAYTSIYQSLSQGKTYPQAKKHYDYILKHGRHNKKVEYKGQEKLLIEICEDFNADYITVVQRINRGWSPWEAIHNCPKKVIGSYQTKNMWFPTRRSFLDYYNMSDKSLTNLIKSGAKLEEMDCFKEYSKTKNYSVYLYEQEFKGSVSEISRESGISREIVEKRLSGEPLQRNRLVYVNGDIKPRKYWCDLYNIDSKKVDREMTKTGATFKGVLKKFGVDTSDLDVRNI